MGQFKIFWSIFNVVLFYICTWNSVISIGLCIYLLFSLIVILIWTIIRETLYLLFFHFHLCDFALALLLVWYYLFNYYTLFFIYCQFWNIFSIQMSSILNCTIFFCCTIFYHCTSYQFMCSKVLLASTNQVWRWRWRGRHG